MTKPFLIYDLDSWVVEDKKIFILGAFESFHLGHYQLIKKGLELKKENPEFELVLVFFDNSSKFKSEKIFTDEKNKERILSTLPINNAIKLVFEEVKNLSPQDFITKLTGTFSNFIFVSGPDFKFGKNAQKSLSQINEYLPNAFCEVVPFFKYKNVKISTSKLKELVEQGDVVFLNSLLYRDYSFTVKLLENNEWSYIDNLVKLPNGIYPIETLVEDFLYYGVILINNECQKIQLLDFKLDESIKEVIIQVRGRFNLLHNGQYNIKDNDLKTIKEYFLDLFKISD